MSSRAKSKSAAAPVQAPCVIFSANRRGGSGKTTSALTIADVFAMGAIEVVPFQVDEQPQLANLLGRRVTSLMPQLGSVDHSPSAMRVLSTPFAPFYSACREAAATNSVVLCDLGANMVDLFARWLHDVELQEDLDTWGMRAVIVVPAVREAAAVSGGIAALAALRRALPQALSVCVENQRDGAYATVLPSTELGRLLRDELPPTLEGCLRLTMPAIEGDAWSTFEAAGLRFLKVLALSPEEIAALTHESVADAKIMRSFVARYLRAMDIEYRKAFDLPRIDS
jgi:hypothetical protein